MSTTAEIREALEWMQHLWCCEDEGMASGQPTAMDYQKARDLVDHALAILADTEGQQEPVAWMSPNGVCISAKVRDLGMNEHGKELYSTPLYTHPSPTAADAMDSPVTYAMSRDYDKLYDRLCAGGEALGYVNSTMFPGVREPMRVKRLGEYDIMIGVRGMQFGGVGSYDEAKYQTERNAFIAECTRLSLEWLAPVDVQEVIRAGDAMMQRIKDCAFGRSMHVGDVIDVAHPVNQWTTATKPFRP